MSYVTDRKVSGFAVLECAFFHETFVLGQCCVGCHDRDRLIIVRPTDEQGLTDWFLGIEARVCCSMYDNVCSISHQQWADWALERGCTRRIDERDQVRSAYTPSSRPHTQGPSRQAYKKKIDYRAQEEEGGLSGFLKR